jgi:hypothetical protein
MLDQTRPLIMGAGTLLTGSRSSSVVKQRGVDTGPVPLFTPRNGWNPVSLIQGVSKNWLLN